jgi:thioredoxin:protein disulfide reductase
MGFLRFVSLGLGMGAVFFAAGSLNLLLRPGPWMVYVRHGFGVAITGAALYYVASSELLSPTGVFVAGFVSALLIGAGIIWHLVKAQGQEIVPAASQGAKVAVAVCLVTLLVAVFTRPAHDLAWTKVHDRAEVLAEVEKAKKEGKAVVVDVWATWCGLCKKYDRMIEGDKDLMKKFGGLRRLRLDVTTDNLEDLRAALRIPNQQPYMVFIDRDGFQRSAQAVKSGKETEKDFARHVDCVEKPVAK